MKLEIETGRSDEELAQFNPTLARDWFDCGFVSLAEFQRWSRIRRKIFNEKSAKQNRITYVDKRNPNN